MTDIWISVLLVLLKWTFPGTPHMLKKAIISELVYLFTLAHCCNVPLFVTFNLNSVLYQGRQTN